jgi:Activator of Hsp90 ATPase homolog 1-like protein
MNRTINVAPVHKTVRVNAAPARAFEVFTAGIGRWWPSTHTIGTAPMKDIVIEPRAGGRWFERGQDGSECDWGVVLSWEPPGRVLLGWHLNSEFKYDAAVATEVELRFIAESAGVTRVELEHRHLERLGPQGEVLRGKIDAPGGWTGVLERYRAAAEGMISQEGEPR